MPKWPIAFQFVVAVLGTWRVAHLMAREDGPFDVIVRLRARAGDGAIGALMDCPHCLGIWIAMPFAWWLSGTWEEWGGCVAGRLRRGVVPAASDRSGTRRVTPRTPIGLIGAESLAF